MANAPRNLKRVVRLPAAQKPDLRLDEIEGAFGITEVLDEDDFASDSDTAIPTQQSAKAYVDTEVAAATVYKAGTDSITDTAQTQAVSFATAFSDANYSVGVSADGDETVWVTSKAAGGFTLNRQNSSGNRAVDWVAWPHKDP